MYLAPFDGAAGSALFKIAKLEGEWSLSELAVLDIGGLDTVEHDDQLRALGRYLIDVPFAPALGIGATLAKLTMAPVP